ncbi:prenyltransferase/squalene oxidase repeat-containing protein [Schlesneria paludicola]|uniref:prenyltransferase/squalene oxidase repeat-containing protein n=1 Tax=Schlesneria paludicola TaxID=360056 RepID=UPI00067FDD31|nr:prenyltransferase/squalene oxidase repeat-containing protein [Schlesneria paludicola]
MPRVLPILSLLLLSSVMLCLGTELAAQTVGPNADQLAKSRLRATNFLKTTQATDGSWTSPEAPGISGLVTFSLLQGGVPASDPVIEKALKHLQTFVQGDGGIYFPKSHHSNYETSICLLAFNAANQSGRYDNLIKQADKFLRKLQWDDSEKCDKSDPKFGGAGYGRTGDRPDLSNTTFFLDALQAAGAKKDDAAVQNALVFLSRCQNLESEYNTTAFASKVNDGGFYYTPAAGGNSQAGNTDNGGLRSYASMTYAGLKSMVFAGLTPDDKRVKAALEWITKHYSVEENPGMGQQGVYYYFQVFAKSLAALDLDYAQDADGKGHDWRKELAEHLFSLQQENGAWLNKNERWYEGDPNLATAYTLMALKYCDPKLVTKGK